jgi:thiamine-monophosphate kinase
LISEYDILNCFQYLVENKPDDIVLVGSGDDAAVIKAQKKDLVHSVDISKINTHFPEDSLPEDIAYRSVAVALSDLAAMGAYPSFISIGLTSNIKEIDWYKNFTKGVEKILEEYQIKLVGGDITFGEMNICVNVFGYPV